MSTERLLSIVGGELEPPEFANETPAEVLRVHVGGILKITQSGAGLVGTVFDGAEALFTSPECPSADEVYQSCVIAGFFPERPSV
jgi:hypothetical protein